MAEKPAKKSKDGEKPKKSNTGLILGIVGCGGLLLLVCCAGGGGGAYWYFKKPPATAESKDKDKGKDKEKEKDKDKGVKGVRTKLKKDYEEIEFGMKFDDVVAHMGNRGQGAGTSTFPKLADDSRDKALRKAIGETRVNLFFEWVDVAANDQLVIGYDLDVVTVKVYFYGDPTMRNVEFAVDPTRPKKKKGKF